MSRTEPSFLLSVILVCGGVLILGCGKRAPLSPRRDAPPRPQVFCELASAKLAFVHLPGETESYYMPQIMGSGCALFDYDGDGDLDLYCVQAGRTPREFVGHEKARESAPGNRLFRNDPGPVFHDVSEESGTADQGYGMGVATGDYDGDGRVDLYVTNAGRNTLYHNCGGGRFEDVSDRAGVGGSSWSASAVFFDCDNDGDLDLFVANYLVLDGRRCPDATGRLDYCGPRSFPGAKDQLYRNLGDGRFEEVSAALGIRGAPRRGLGVIAADLSGDGRLDLYVANDNDPNQLWVAQEDGSYRDEGVERGLAFNESGRAEASMGVVCDDLDLDGDLDLFLTHMSGETNTFYRNDGRGNFDDATRAVGLGGTLSLEDTGFGAVAIDVDLDGQREIAVANGRVFRGPSLPGAVLPPHWRPYAQQGRLYRRDGDVFRSLDWAGPLSGEALVGRGLAWGDIDNDGAPDLVLCSTASRPRILFNRAPSKGRWIRISALAPGGRRDAPGAVVTVKCGSWQRSALVGSGGSYLCASDPRLLFGLGEHDTVDWVSVRWPDASTERFPGGPAQSWLRIEKGRGQ